MDKKLRIETKCVQGGYTPGNGEPRQIPIIQSTTFKYSTSEDMGKLFDLEASGYFYSRLQNPTCDTVAARICALEGGTAAMLTSSGQAANFFAVFNIASAGDHVVASSAIYGGTYNLFSVTMKRMGVDFDKIYYESDTYLEGKDLVLGGIEKGIMYRKEDNPVWADLAADGLDHKLLLRGDGTSVYMTQDIGTAKLRYQDYPIDKMVYVVGNEQNYHFQVLALLLDKLGFKWGKDLVHFSYGMVELPHGKMKSREGTVVDADDLMDEMINSAAEASAERMKDIPADEAAEIARVIGLGALKYFLLKVDPRKNMMFNPQESIDFNGNTGPFIQYTYARIQSVLRRAQEQAAALTVKPVPSEKEVTLIQKIADFPSVVEDAGRNYSPAVIANYCYDLAKEYNQFYHDYPILKEEDENVRAMRLLLSSVTARTLKSAVALLGIEMPNRM